MSHALLIPFKILFFFLPFFQNRYLYASFLLKLIFISVFHFQNILGAGLDLHTHTHTTHTHTHPRQRHRSDKVGETNL